jgi:hypothetical protein
VAALSTFRRDPVAQDFKLSFAMTSAQQFAHRLSNDLASIRDATFAPMTFAARSIIASAQR